MTLKSGRLNFLRADDVTGAGDARLPTHEIDAADTKNWLSYDITDRVTEKIKIQYFATDKTTIAEKIIGDVNIFAAHPQIFPDEIAAKNYDAAAIAKLKPETQTIHPDIPIRPDLRAGYPLSVRNLPAGIATEFK